MKQWNLYPDWYVYICCKGGMRDHFSECSTCEGLGFLAWHKPSHVLALYPGGPLRGKTDEVC